MFCPKCGIENPDNVKFCRSCGANLSKVLAVVDGTLPSEQMLAAEENPADLFSTGIRNIILGFGFLVAGIFLFTMPPSDGIFWLLMMIPGFSLLASGISRLVKAEALKKERAGRANAIYQPAFSAPQPKKELPPSQADYISPVKSVYETDDLAAEPLSVTEGTTRHLKINSGTESTKLPGK